MDISTAAQVLEAQGFTIIRQSSDEVLATRQRFYVACCVRMATIVRVQKTGHQTLADARSSQTWLLKHAGELDVSYVPRGFAQGRSIIDVFLCDEAEDQAVAWAGKTVHKFMGGAYHPVVVTPEATTHDTPIWGAAYWPFNKFLIEQIASGDSSRKSEPLASMGVVIGLMVMWPGMMFIAGGCCGLPLIYLPIAWSLEAKKQAGLSARYAAAEPQPIEASSEPVQSDAPPEPTTSPDAAQDDAEPPPESVDGQKEGADEPSPEPPSGD